MSRYRTLRFRITSAVPLLMHNGRLADPLDEHARAMARVADKRPKTEADHERLAELEFLGGLYLSGGVPCIPAEMMEAALVKAATQRRRGAKARAGLVVRDNLALTYEGPTEPRALWADERFRLRAPVRIGVNRVMRTRPMFRDWSAALVVEYLPALLNASDVRGFLVLAGEQVGVGDWRPRFGRFWVEDLPAEEAGAVGTGACGTPDAETPR
jgi:hypothetical protein